MIPSALGEVDERTHSPRNAIILCTLAGELSIIALINIPQASLLGALMAQIIAYIIVGIARIIFPYRMRDVWQASGGRTIAGILSIALAGIASVIVLGGQLFLFVTNNDINLFFGVTRDISLMVAGLVIGSGIVWYLVAWWYNQRRGVGHQSRVLSHPAGLRFARCVILRRAGPLTPRARRANVRHHRQVSLR